MYFSVFTCLGCVVSISLFLFTTMYEKSRELELVVNSFILGVDKIFVCV